MSTLHTLTFERLQLQLAPRARNTHKGDYGHVLVIGGDTGTGGAAIMAAEAAARSGAGLTSLATRPEHVAAALQRRPEVMVRAISGFAGLDADSNTVLQEMAARASAIVLGPGLGRSDWSRGCMLLILDIAASQKLPMVLDADALNMLASESALSKYGHECQWILTPHTGEASRLLGINRVEVDEDREHAVTALQDKFGGVAILKGPGTLVCHMQENRQQVALCPHGNPGMASGGMGDVLSGILGGLLAQQYSLADSARLGVTIHSKAADLAAAQHGERGLLATDLLPYMHRLLNP